MRLSISAVLCIACFSGCSDIGENEVKEFGIPTGGYAPQYKQASGLFKKESAVMFKIKESAMSTRVPDFYRSQLERAGWIRCSGAILGKWGSFIDEAKGPPITVYQYRELFQKRDAIAEVLIEQARPDAAITDKQATQTVLVRVNTNEPKACSLKTDTVNFNQF